MKPVQTVLAFLIVSLSLSVYGQTPISFFNVDEFTGLESSADVGYANAKLDYPMNLKDGKEINFTNCQQVVSTSEDSIKSSQFFLFRILTANCIALKKYSASNRTYKTYFAKDISVDFIKKLPAVAVPLLNHEDKQQRLNKTINAYEVNAKINLEKPGRFKILTKADEYYVTVMARADFDMDGFEDILIRTEWYSREAFGKHVDLLILSKVKKDQEVTISWRYMNL